MERKGADSIGSIPSPLCRLPPFTFLSPILAKIFFEKENRGMTSTDLERTFSEQVERRRRTAKTSSHSLTATAQTT